MYTESIEQMFYRPMRLPTLFRIQQIPKNILPHGGESLYHGVVFDEGLCDRLFETLLVTARWKRAEWIIYDKHHVTARKVSWYGKHADWPEDLLAMKKEIEQITGIQYRGVLLNLYETGDIGLGAHADEEMWHEGASIASVSLGAERKFTFRHNDTNELISIILEHGSLLVMDNETQLFWKHALPKARRVRHPRINLTFRT